MSIATDSAINFAKGVMEMQQQLDAYGQRWQNTMLAASKLRKLIEAHPAMQQRGFAYEEISKVSRAFEELRLALTAPVEAKEPA